MCEVSSCPRVSGTRACWDEAGGWPSDELYLCEAGGRRESLGCRRLAYRARRIDIAGVYAIVESNVAAMGTGGLGCRPRWVVEVQFAGRLNERAGRSLNAGRVLEGAGHSLEHCGRRRDVGEAVKGVERSFERSGRHWDSGKAL